jgi:hypothetical protein
MEKPPTNIAGYYWASEEELKRGAFKGTPPFFGTLTQAEVWKAAHPDAKGKMVPLYLPRP